jgi:8-oxo-dGTP pyrophosphatase MutT (NUDIX family)
MASNPVNQIVCSGGIFLAKDTKRFLFLLRNLGSSSETWGLVGGKVEPTDGTPYEGLKREISEEIGKTPAIKKVIPLELFTSNDQQFHYNTYVLIVEKEFIPVLNVEHSGYAWCSINKWPKPLHQGVKNTVSNRSIKSKLELLLDLI